MDFVTQGELFNPISGNRIYCEMNGFIFPYISRLVKKEQITHNVMRFSIQKPMGFRYVPGQAVDLSIDQAGYELDVAPFTIISLEEDQYLEFIIKIRPDRNSLTYRLSNLKLGKVIQVSKPWNTFEYKGSGYFIAAGTGIVPFMPILEGIYGSRPDFTGEHKVLYAGKDLEDILFKHELKHWFGSNFTTILSRAETKSIFPNKVNFEFLQSVVQKKDRYFYICGPKSFEFDTMTHLLALGVDQVNIQTGYRFGQVEQFKSLTVKYGTR